MTPLWTPTEQQVRDSHLYRFREGLRADHDIPDDSFAALHRWSVSRLEDFWAAAWLDATGQAPAGPVLADGAMPPAGRLEREVWFPGTRFNFAAQLLRHRDERVAIIEENELGQCRTVTFRELHALAGRCQAGLRRAGVGPGDRVAGYLPNVLETVVAMLATASLGAVWTATSADFGFQGVFDRFSQIHPKVLVSADGYSYNGRRHDCIEKTRRLVDALPGLERWVVVPGADARLPGGATAWESFLEAEPAEPTFADAPFDHPVYILYTSGTTGLPKCIVHGAGGTALKHHVEHKLHTDVDRDDTVFFFTTCGWMMWHWLVSGLAQGATVVLYDGSPAYPNHDRLFRLAEDHGITVFGTSPKLLATLEKNGFHAAGNYRLDGLRAVLSTGSPLEASQFHYVHDAVKPDAQVCSISGGTDIIGCFVLGNPISPVYPGQIQGPALGVDVAVFDEQGRPLAGEQGELVCRKPFPSMPLGFWDDPGEARYRETYFDTYPGVWRHGDYLEATPEQGFVIHGRSDTTLNPAGIRFGTAEIYRIIERMPFVQDSIVAGYRHEHETRVALFVVLDRPLDPETADAIRAAIRAQATPRHVPAIVRQISQVPVTRNGKKVEKAVSAILNHEPVRNREALANPEALDEIEACIRGS
ncbi:MAG: acetoacetate--CoA ligase [Deltaproteobacteria bacterium]|nr:acetoacetate--CoA ligase [Deltaproteobacteria bacterium]